jgi:hypothetical protein
MGEGMRKAFFLAIAALVVVAGLMPATAASAGAVPRVRYYEGPTSAGGRLRISVVIKDGVPYLTLLLIDGPYSCEDGTQGEIVDDGVGWFPKGPAIEDAHLELSENWHAVAFMVSGRLGSHQGSGTLTFLMPGFTANRQAAQVCTTGELTWSVERTSGEDFPFKPAVSVKGRGQGTLMMGLGESSSEGTALAPTETSPIRHYRGRTSQELSMAAQTQWTNSRIAMRGLSVGYLLTCEDGTENEGGIRPLAFFDSTQVMPPGRLDLDVAPSSRIGLALVLNLHGELDAHAGSGTLTITSPELTDDLGAQLCKTGAQTWDLWRTDAGH